MQAHPRGTLPRDEDKLRESMSPMRAFLVTAPSDAQDLVLACLWELGTTGIEEKPAALLAYFDDGMTADTLQTALGETPGVTVAPAAIPDVDWVARFRENFRAFAV